MNKKGKSIEMQLYELLGVKIFRKMAFGLRKAIFFPFTIFMSKKSREKFYNTPDNYNMKKGHGLQDLRDFKKMLLLNASIHMALIFKQMPDTFKVISGTASTSTTVITLTAIGLNLYCIMLQRYNHIRINQVLKKDEVRKQKQKDAICKELKEENEMSNNVTHKIVNKKHEEVPISFEKFLQTASLQQLKDYKESLEYAKRTYDYYQPSDEPSQMNMNIPLEKGKSLKLELKLNKHNKGAN